MIPLVFPPWWVNGLLMVAIVLIISGWIWAKVLTDIRNRRRRK